MAKVFTITSGLENLGAIKTGGQGSVYKGRRVGDIITAIKILPTPIYSESAEDKNFISFQNEVHKLKKVNENPNPNVVKILGSGITDSGNLPFIEMEFIEGPDLQELLEPPNDPVFTIKESIKVADHLSSALAHCHQIEVMHGDIKSNNVKYNINTGIYVLLDFGLALMSDEQRRTSLRHAGAIEFMAPEQSEGIMLSQTDIYAFGVILFELLAGTVPFPLKDKGESARNQVVIAHLERLPPDLLLMRRNAMPDSWNQEKKESEMQVPEWLVKTIYKCLEKKPENRFKNGSDLHDYVCNNSTRSINISNFSNNRIRELEHENARLRQEMEQLQHQLSGKSNEKGAAVNSIKTTAGQGLISREKLNFNSKYFSAKNIALTLGLLAVVVVLVYAFFNNGNNKDGPVSVKNNVAEYKIAVPIAYFYEDPERGKRSNLSISANKEVTALGEKNDFIYTEIVSESGELLKGWLRKQDVTLKGDSLTQRAEETNPEIRSQLQNAKRFFNEGKTVEALIIYNTLAKSEVPEAMYHYGKLALQNKNANISCTEAFELLKKASDKGLTDAKTTLGFIYSFADDKAMLQRSNYYERCSFGKNVSKGSKLLVEAMLEGDTAASRLIDTLNVRQRKG